MRITRGENDRISAGERRCYQNCWLVDHPAHEIRNERNVQTSGVSDRWTIRHSETEQIDGVNSVRPRERVDVVSPFVGPGGSVNAVDQENGWAAATLGEGDSPVAPFKTTLFASDQVGGLIDTFARKSIIGCRGAEERTTGQKNSSPRSFSLPESFSLVVIRHDSSHRCNPASHSRFRSQTEKRGYLRVTAPWALRTGAAKITAGRA